MRIRALTAAAESRTRVYRRMKPSGALSTIVNFWGQGNVWFEPRLPLNCGHAFRKPMRCAPWLLREPFKTRHVQPHSHSALCIVHGDT